MENLAPRAPRIRKVRRRRAAARDFASYLSFGVYSTTFLAFFLGCYLLVLLCILPMLEVTREGPPERGVRFSGFEGAHLPRKEDVVHVARAAKDKWGKMKGKFQHEDLLAAASAEFKAAESKKKVERGRSKGTKGLIQDSVKAGGGSVRGAPKGAHKQRSGFVVLGMHRSGTSMLSGLLVTGMDYNVGGPLIGAAFDNEKGFFERIDVVLQNDEFMKSQGIWWADRVKHYDANKAIEAKRKEKIKFQEGKKSLLFLNDRSNAPWLQKDPRMCITLRTWLPLLSDEPAVLFTYRHPLEVAMSLKKREQNFSLERGLRLWIIYNWKAVQNSADLCRVLSSNEAILADPLHEVQRISDQLTEKCGVPAPPKQITQKVVNDFIDPGLQHNKKKREQDNAVRKLLHTFDNGCTVNDYESDFQKGTSQRESEEATYLNAMKIYCDFKSGEAYKDEYSWPELP
eukprot:CAMPEP_0113565824 /NCGR_PEP_ID=MMETSP0015_2-20120614/22390_1 /TAXON_ID=2838 /ORGANISM="Odontella" /LENGTH=455 /DNA_ID=CAMNT_0000468061 /DNA_START=101 /DNA_END=1468 /DNA_ORIENTATION=+ /assembly_acc=CAM_ASM_000160